MLKRVMMYEKWKYFCLFVGIVLILSVTACQKKEQSIIEQTKDVEKIIERLSKGEAVAEKDFAAISFADGAKQKILEKMCLELDSSQIFTIVGLEKSEPETQRIPLTSILEANAETGKELYQSFLEKQKENLGKVQPSAKRFSKMYEQDGLGYVFVEAPFQFEKLVVAGKEFTIEGCTLYRAYVWQKIENQWKLSECQEQVYLAEEDMRLLVQDNSNVEEQMKADREKFLTVFGERVVFE